MASPNIIATFAFDAGPITDAMEAAARATMEELAGEIQPYLVATLHRWGSTAPGEHMADTAFAWVEQTAAGFTLHAGAGTDHAIHHERRYHPQLRETMDRFGPLMGPRLAAHL